MKKLLWVFSKMIPGKRKEEYTTRQWIGVVLSWSLFLLILFLLLKFILDWFHLNSWWPR